MPLSAGWAMTGVFAPTFLPEWTQAVFFGAALVSVAWGSCAIVWHYRAVWGRQMIGPILVLICGLSAVMGGVFLVWHGAIGMTGSYKKSEANSLLDYTIKLRCDMYYPSDGLESRDTWYYNVYMTPRPEMDPRSAISTQPIVAGTKIRTEYVGKPGSALKCKLYNQGDRIITSAQFRFTLKWQVDNVTDPKDPRGADVAPVEYISPPLDMGDQENNREAYFYILNTSDSFLQIVPSEMVEVKVTGSDTLNKARLVTGNGFHNQALLWPGRRFTNFLDASHPAPMPPASPAGK